MVKQMQMQRMPPVNDLMRMVTRLERTNGELLIEQQRLAQEVLALTEENARLKARLAEREPQWVTSPAWLIVPR